MAKSDEVLDRVFREKLENHEAFPSPAAWDKLEAQLDAAKQPKKSSWWAIAAAMPLLLGLGYLIWSQAPQAEQENSLAAIEEVSTSTPVSVSPIEAETVVSEEVQKPVSLAEASTSRASKPIQKSSFPQENSKEVNLGNVVAEAVTVPSLQTAVAVEVNSTTESKTLLTPEPTQTTPSPSTSQPSLADAEDLVGYRIRIFSDGLKKEEAPNKNLITELGKTVGQVEGLLDKLDEGFVEIQDKKERLFSSLTSRKTPSIEKQ
jgi:cytoskeletal protein RodZ